MAWLDTIHVHLRKKIKCLLVSESLSLKSSGNFYLYKSASEGETWSKLVEENSDLEFEENF